MKNQLNLYKDISLEILKSLRENRFDDLDNLINKRYILINEVDNINEFKKSYLKEDTYNIDKEIQEMFSKELDSVKSEIKEYKLSQMANNSYVHFNKEKINIFNKKV